MLFDPLNPQLFRRKIMGVGIEILKTSKPVYKREAAETCWTIAAFSDDDFSCSFET